MNRFLSRKKTDPNDGDSTHGSVASPVKDKRWKKNKKPQDVQKPELDFRLALPSSDEFRTSLIMPNLSARFSMLREQDDPSSKLGKAADDSVLTPRRHSRMMDLGYMSRGLSDIAEVASINGSVRPPFLQRQHDSFVSEEGYGTDNDSQTNGSIMSRARPGEGNVMFGGRQKVYKIAASSGSSLRAGVSSSALGKAVYEDDVNTSAFQQYRQQEKERLEREQGLQDHDSENSPHPSSDHEENFPFPAESRSTPSQKSSPDAPKMYTAGTSPNKRQRAPDSSSPSPIPQMRSFQTSTSSSSLTQPQFVPTAASQNQIQTAAQSEPRPAQVPGPGLERSNTKRRLYEQGLDQHIYEQQASQLTRLNSIQRQRTLNGTRSPPLPLSHAKSVGNLQDRSYQPYTYRAQSPPVHPLTTFGSIRIPTSNGSSPVPSGPQSPTFPNLNEYDESGVLSSALQPGDRGKATAMGAFNKPKQQFDEAQYLQRLQQLQQRRDIPSPTEHPMPNTPNKNLVAISESARREGVATDRRPRSQSSPIKPEVSHALSVFQNAAAQARAIQHSPSASPNLNTASDTHRTFFGDISASDTEDDEDNNAVHGYTGGWNGPHLPSGRFTPTALSSVSEHPAMRDQHPAFAEIEEEEEEEDLQPVQPVQTLHPQASSRSLRAAGLTVTSAPSVQSEISPRSADSDALGGLVHSHLRKESYQSSIDSEDPRNTLVADQMHARKASNQSSIYPTVAPRNPSVPSLTDDHSRSTRHTYSSENRMDSTYTNSNPWDLDEFDGSYYYGEVEPRKSPPTVAGAQQRSATQPSPPSRPSPEIHTDADTSVDTSLPEEEDPANSGTAWQSEPRSGHNRDASTATLQEREAFANDLAARQKAIQENLRSMVESQSQSRGSSPQPTSSGALKAFGMLKQKSSRESMTPRQQDPPSKAMKTLGLNAGALSNGQQPFRANDRQVDDGRFEQDRNMAAQNGRRPLASTTRAPSAGDQNKRIYWPGQRPRTNSETSLRSRPSGQHPSDRSPPQTSAGNAQARDRSDSTASNVPSVSRVARYREDGPSAEVSPMMTQNGFPQPSPDVHQHPADAQNRMRSNSRPTGLGYFDPRTYSAVQPALANGRLTPASISASAPVSTSGTPAASPSFYKPSSIGGAGPRAGPMTTSYASNMTPPVSAGSTPTSHGTNSPVMPHIPFSKPQGNMLRKKTVSKHEISEPTLISSTSNVDTVDLPPGASLKNGMDTVNMAPLNPRRRKTQRLFTFGRDASPENIAPPSSHRSPPPPAAESTFARVRSPEAWTGRPSEEQQFRQASGGSTGYRDARDQGRSNVRSPDSFERRPFQGMRSPEAPALTEGGMF